MNSTQALEIKNLKKTFPGFTLGEISFSLPMGCIMGFIGLNGAGKTTTIKLIMDLLKPDSGTISLFGQLTTASGASIRQEIGFVYDENCYYEELTLQQMKSLVSRIYKKWDENQYQTVIKQFGLNPQTKIKTLSKGMKTKFSLAIALSHHAKLLILDEPTSGLDPASRRELLDLFSQIIHSGETSIFYSTHITSDLEKNTDYIIFLDNGRILLDKSKDEIIESHALIKGSLEALNTTLENQCVGVTKNSFGFEALVADRTHFTQQPQIINSILIEKPSIEDIVLYYTRRKTHAHLSN